MLQHLVHFVDSIWTADATVPSEKSVLTCNVSEEEGAFVYWTKNQEWQGNGKNLEITIKEPLDAGIYLCWSNITHERLTSWTVYLTKRHPNGEIAHPVLRPLPGRPMINTVPLYENTHVVHAAGGLQCA